MDVPGWISKGPIKDHSEYLRKFILALKNDRKEMEIRLGRIISKEDGSRMRIDTVAPVVLKNLPVEYRFESAVDVIDFKRLKEMFSSCSSECTNDLIVINEDGRETYENNELKKVEKKMRSEKLDIYMPGKKYDVRIVLNEESETFKQASRKAALVRRARQRETYFIGPYGFDFTSVIVSGERDEKGKDKKKLEIEVEVIDSDRLVSSEFISLIYNLNIESS